MVQPVAKQYGERSFHTIQHQIINQDSLLWATQTIRMPFLDEGTQLGCSGRGRISGAGLSLGGGVVESLRRAGVGL